MRGGDGPGLGGPDTTFAQLFEEFLMISVARGRSPTTIHGYRTTITGFWLPELGAMRIGDLTVHGLDTLYARMRTRERPAATSTIRRYHAILSATLTQAVKWHWIATNVARLATLPGSETPALTTPTPEQVRALIAACTSESDVLGMFVTVAAVTGCRRGELAALKWCHYDDDALHISSSAYNVGGEKGVKATKTGRQRRVVVHERLAEALETWRCDRAGMAAAAGFTYDKQCYVFSDRADGRMPVNVNTISTKFRRVAQKLGLDSIHFHSLRHFAATQLINSGVDPRTAASRLGHANPSLTLRVYAHATADSDLEAAEVGARILDRPSALDDRGNPL